MIHDLYCSCGRASQVVLCPALFRNTMGLSLQTTSFLCFLVVHTDAEQDNWVLVTLRTGEICHNRWGTLCPWWTLGDDASGKWLLETITFGQLGIGSTASVRNSPNTLTLVPSQLFASPEPWELDGVRLASDASEALELSYNGSWGLICDDGWDDAAARVSCRDLGLAGGKALFTDFDSSRDGEILVDGLTCLGDEVSLRNCSFKGWKNHDCTAREMAGVQCQLDAWTQYSVVAPAGREGHSLVWDDETQSAFLFGGQASHRFQYFSDLWRLSFPFTWAQLSAGPPTRSGHSAVWDAASRSMLIFAGRYLSTFYNDLWQYFTATDSWQPLQALHGIPSARIDHTAVWDMAHRAMFIFAGEGSGGPLNDLSRYSLTRNSWSTSSATSPSPRSGHAAVWDPTTMCMLVFAGWTGAEYLGDLHLYNWWTDQWTELLPTSGVPSARGGHAAAWDPRSMSMFIFAGTQNDTGELSYDRALYRHSLLSNTWAQLPGEGGPVARAQAAMAWGKGSQERYGLLVFGGFNTLYLEDTWRYAASPMSTVPVMRCQIGQDCTLNFSAPDSSLHAAARVTVKQACVDREVVPGLAIAELAEADILEHGFRVGSPLFLQPGHHRLCVCPNQACNQTTDFSDDLGVFIVEGPLPNQSRTCFTGEDCVVPVQGIGMSLNDTVMALAQCGGSLATAIFGEQTISVSFDDAADRFVVDLGFVDAASRPDTVHLCWCPAGCECSVPEAFRATAMQLHVVCPPGQYEVDGACQPCEPGFWVPFEGDVAGGSYCPGGGGSLPCPSSSSSSPGSSQISQCLCDPAHYWSTETSACINCPYGSTTLEPGATALSSCTCLPGFVNLQPDNPAICECGPGYGYDTSLRICEPCQKGTFKGVPGNQLCSVCPRDRSTLEVGSTSSADCRCQPGLVGIDNCTECFADFFCPGTGEAFECPNGATSPAGSTSASACICRPGYRLLESMCEPCQSGRYKLAPGNATECPFQCPTNSESGIGSTSLADCYCSPGYFAEQDVAGQLTRCATCAAQGQLRCLGGFQTIGNESVLHMRPIAEAGFFQTGRVVAIKCHVDAGENLSVCRGGGACLETENPTVNCVGNFSNECAEGSTGMLCGECPSGWSRQAFRRTCQPCDSSLFGPGSSILAHVSLKAALSLFVASTAATAAVRGNTKLLTSMIRIGQQWLAACSVIATFDLGQTRIISFSQQEPDNLDWPIAVTQAFRRLYEVMALTPTIAPVEFTVQCAAQEVSDGRGVQVMALGIYYLCLPAFVVVATILVCAAAVYVLVPVAGRYGRSFNEAAKRKKNKEKEENDKKNKEKEEDDKKKASEILEAEVEVCEEAGISFAEAGGDSEAGTGQASIPAQPITEGSDDEADEDVEVDEVLDALDFGLFTAWPDPRSLIVQSLPVIWVSLVSLWPSLLSGFLQLMWCVPLPEGDDQIVSRLLPSPDIVCGSPDHSPAAWLAIAGLIIWCLGTPLALALRLAFVRDRQAPDNFRQYGYFIQGFEPVYWWWDLLVKNADVGLMMTITYTSIVEAFEAKLLLFPVISGVQLATAAWVRPFANDQAQLLDVLEVMLCSVRFFLFSSIAAMLMLNPPPVATHSIAVGLFAMIALACLYLMIHALAQFLRDSSKSRPKKGHRFLVLLDNVRRASVNRALKVVQQADTEKMLVEWSFESEVVTVRPPRWAEVSRLRRLWGFLLRFGPSFQQAILLKVMEEFHTFLAEANQTKLPGMPVLCALATCQRSLPHLIVKSRMAEVWLRKLRSLAKKPGSNNCSPEDLARALTRLRQMVSTEALHLVQEAVMLFQRGLPQAIVAESAEHAAHDEIGDAGMVLAASGLEQVELS
ncbi:lgals3bpb [Symbiodinium natans]|uniref:Lgals3bpb protein n=1 Tax=Symbiodinium natans TaxID=878477 RepID=A0A812U2C9_9DINO|nr:lgals3bpb [Symbiodinium natans]